jgi:hypothetical protein
MQQLPPLLYSSGHENDDQHTNMLHQHQQMAKDNTEISNTRSSNQLYTYSAQQAPHCKTAAQLAMGASEAEASRRGAARLISACLPAFAAGSAGFSFFARA